MNKNLEDYLKLVIPQPLDDNEYIRLFFKIAEPKQDAPSKFVRFVKTFEEVEEMINKYKFFCNIFISLSTYKKKLYLMINQAYSIGDRLYLLILIKRTILSLKMQKTFLHTSRKKFHGYTIIVQ